MKKVLGLMAAAALVASVSATPVDITMDDGLLDGNSASGYVAGEDQTVNFGSDWGQEWDLEGFTYDNATNELTAIGGFDPFAAHINWGGSDWMYIQLGDIFVETDGDGDYDYVIDFTQGTQTWDNKSYAIYDINAGYTPVPLSSGTAKDYNTIHPLALPYAYGGGGVKVAGSEGTFVVTPTTDAQGSHYALSNINLTSIGDQSFEVRQTMSCGNDVHVGRVPEPATLALLGFGLLGLGLIRRKK